MSLPTERTEHHFVLKEDGKIYWIEKVPEKPFNLNPVIQDIGLRQKYQRDHADYWQALQSAISNAVEVSNQGEVRQALLKALNWNPDPSEHRFDIGVPYSLQCSVEKQVIPGIVNKPWFTALVTFSQRVEEQKETVMIPLSQVFNLILMYKCFYNEETMDEVKEHYPIHWAHKMKEVHHWYQTKGIEITRKTP